MNNISSLIFMMTFLITISTNNIHNIDNNNNPHILPGDVITELDEPYKDLFEYNENEIRIMGFDDDYLVAVEHEIDGLEIIESTYYFVNKRDYSKIKIATSDSNYGYSFENSNDDMSKKDGTTFNLISYNYSNSSNEEEKPHIIGIRYFDKKHTTSGETDILTKSINYGIFKNGENTVKLYEGDSFLNMAADDIYVLYHLSDNLQELVMIRIQFTGEVTLTGKLSVSIDEEFGYQVYFIADSKSINKLPHHVEDLRGSGGLGFINENLKEILGEEPFDTDCEITIKDYNIFYAATEAYNTAELIKVNKK